MRRVQGVTCLLVCVLSSGCAPKIVARSTVGPIALSKDGSLALADIVHTNWDAGWGWFSPVNGPHRWHVMWREQPDEATSKSEYRVPIDRDMDAIGRAIARLYALGEPHTLREYALISLDPPVLVFTQRVRGQWPTTTLTSDRLRGFVSPTKLDQIVDGYVVAAEGLWREVKRDQSDESFRNAVRLREVVVQQRIRMLIEQAPWRGNPE